MSDYAVRAVLEAYDHGFTSGMKKAASAISSTESAAGSLGSRLKSGLGFGALMAIGQKAVNVVSSAITNNLGSAIKRFDTLNNFPKIMKNLGYSAGDARKAIDKMSAGIDGLPTALDDIAGATTKIAPLTGSLDKATNVTLALNNALLAGGKDAMTQANALEQFSQMLSAGKVDMQAWRSMLSAMPGQMNQLAQSILGPKASAHDLYDAMKDGEVSFDDFNKALINLNEEGLEIGGKKFASFADQAKDATQGIGTSVSNLKTGVVKGLTTMIEKADGILHISSNINKLNKGIKGLMGRIAESKTFSNVLKGTTKTAKAFIPAVKMVGSLIGKAAVAFGKGVKYIGDHTDAVKKLAKALAILWAAFKGVSVISSFGGAITSAAGAVRSFSGAIKASGGLASAFAGSTVGIGLAAAGAVASVGILSYAVYTLAKRYKAAEREAKSNIQARKDTIDATDLETSRVDSLYRRLEELNGVEKKSKDEKLEMKWIIDQLNGSIDGLNAKYDEETGKVKGGTKEIKKRIDAYKEEARAAALKDSLKGAYKDQQENEKKLAEVYEKRLEAQKKADKYQRDGLSNKGATKKAQQDFKKYDNQYKDLEAASKRLNDEIAGLEQRMSNMGSMNAFDDLVAKARKAGIDVSEGFIASVKEGQVEVPTTVFGMVRQMYPAFDEAVRNAQAAGVKIPPGIRKGIKSGELTPQQAVAQINALIDQEHAKQPPKSEKAGGEVSEKMGDGIKNKKDVARTAAQSLANAALSGASESRSYGSQRGGEFGQGYASGIRGMLDQVAAAAKAAAATASSSSRSAQKSGSPSRVAMKIGNEYGAGYVIGIQQKAREVAQAARRLVNIPDSMSPRLDLALGGDANMRASVQYSMSSLADSLKNEIIDALLQRPLVVQPSVEIDGRQVAKATAPYMEEDISALQKRANRKKGIR